MTTRPPGDAERFTRELMDFLGRETIP